MNKTKPLALFATILLTFSVFKGFAPAQLQSIGKVNFILGNKNNIQVIHPGYRNWLSASLYSPVYHGDRFKTKSESRCEIKLAEKGTIRVGENADFILRPATATRRSSSVLNSGRLWASIKGLLANDQSRFQIRTPTAVCSVRGTIYRIDTDSSTKVLVYAGEVDVGPLSLADDETNQQQQTPQPIIRQPIQVPGPTQIPGPFEVSLEDWVRIIAGQQIEVRADGKYHKTEINKQADAEDDWVSWNKQRDALK